MRINKTVSLLLLLLTACGQEEYEWQGPPPRPALFNKECGEIPRLRLGEWCSEWHHGEQASCSAGATELCCTRHGCYQR